MEKKKLPKEKAAVAPTKGSFDAAGIKALAQTPDVTGGLRIVSLGPGDLLVRDHHGAMHQLRPKETGSFTPVMVQGGSAVKAPLPGMTMAAPASVLWLEVKAPEKEGCACLLDPTELVRHGARWGRPILLAYVGGLQAKPDAWQMITSRTEKKLSAGEQLLLVGVGHGLHFEVQEIFSTLFAPMKGKVDADE
jgi:hypothetical protein